MHNPGKSCKLIKFSPLASLPEAEAEFLEETFDVVAVNYTDDGLEEYVGYAPLDFDAEDFRRRGAARGLKLPLFCCPLKHLLPAFGSSDNDAATLDRHRK